MPNPLTPFGIFHTAVSVLPIVFGVWALLRDGKIDISNRMGMLYLVTMVIGCVTGLFIFHHGGFGPGHVLSILTLALLFVGVIAGRVSWLGGAQDYVATISFSATYFLLIFFATTETLTRLPVDHPYAPSQDAAELIPVRVVLLVALLAGIGYQVYRLRGARKALA